MAGDGKMQRKYHYNDQSEKAARTLSLASSKKHLWEKNKGFEPSASLVLKID